MNMQHTYGTLSLSLLKLKLDCAAAAARGLCCPHRHFGWVAAGNALCTFVFGHFSILYLQDSELCQVTNLKSVRGFWG